MPWDSDFDVKMYTEQDITMEGGNFFMGRGKEMKQLWQGSLDYLFGGFLLNSALFGLVI